MDMPSTKPGYRYTFISHAHADNALCDPYAEALSRLGVPHYYDRSNPQVGHDIGEALERELLRAQALIVLATPQALASVWVREEINIFYALSMREPGRLIIPVKVAPCALPPRLEARWWVDGVGRPAQEVVAEVARALEGTATSDIAPGSSGSVVSAATVAPSSRAPEWLTSGRRTVERFTERRSLDCDFSWVNSVAWSPDGLWLATGCSDEVARAREAPTGRLHSTFTRHSESVGQRQ